MRTKNTTWFWPTDVHSICVTVWLPPHSLHSGRDFHGGQKRVGESGRICAALYQGRCKGLRPTPKNLGSLKTIVVMILVAGVAVLATSRRILLCMHDACNKNKQPSEQRREGDNDQTDQKEETPKPERKAEGVGCESGT